MWPRPAEVPARLPARAQRAGLRARLRRPDDADLDAGSGEPLVERSGILLGLRPLAVDHEADGNARGGLLHERVGESLADDAGPEPELVDVDRRPGGVDVLEHRRVEVPPLDVYVDGRSSALGKREGEIVPAYRRRHEPESVLPDLADRAGEGGYARQTPSDEELPTVLDQLERFGDVVADREAEVGRGGDDPRDADGRED